MKYMLMLVLLTGCGTIILPSFPDIQPKWKYTVILREMGNLYEVRCLKRCFSLTHGKRVTPDRCGMQDWTDEVWYTDPRECNTTDGFWTSDWIGRQGIIPWLKDIRRYVEDNLKMIVLKGQQLLEGKEKK